MRLRETPGKEEVGAAEGSETITQASAMHTRYTLVPHLPAKARNTPIGD